jgi:hypothetical protein
MSVNVVLNGQTYTIPDPGDNTWGQELTDYFVALGSGVLQKAGGTFTLTAEVDFGATYGLKASYFKSRTTNVSSTGTIRLAKTDFIGWRDNLNQNDLELGVDSSDRLTFNGNPLVPSTPLTASRAVVTDASGVFTTATTTATEIGYVNGVTSAIQTQIDSKQATGNYITALTGDVTASGPGSVAATIGANKVTLGMMAQVATATFLGRTTAGTGNVEALTATQATALLNAFVGDSGSGGTKGLVPAPASGDAAAGKVLGAGGGWVTTGAGDVVGPSSAHAGGLVLFDGTTGKLVKESTITQHNALTSGANGTVSSVAPSTAGNIFMSDGTDWTSASVTHPYGLRNLGFASSQSGGVLTGAIKQASGSDPSTGASTVFVTMRSSTATSGTYNQRTFTGAASLAISVQTTLGLTSAKPGYVYWYAIDSDGSGAMKIGASSTRYDDGTPVTTMKESDTATITIASPGVVSVSGNTLANGDQVIFTTTGALPTGLTAGSLYYVVQYGTDGAGKFRLATSPNGTDINTSGTQSGTHTIHVADGRMVSDGYYSGAPCRLIGRSIVTQTSGSYASATEDTVSPINSGRTIYLGSTQGTNGTVTAASFTNFSNRVVSVVIPGSTGRYLTSFTGPFKGDTNSKAYYIKINNPTGSATNLAENQATFQTAAATANTDTQLYAWRLDWLTAGTVYTFELQGAVQTATNTLTLDTGGLATSGVQLITEQVN